MPMNRKSSEVPASKRALLRFALAAVGYFIAFAHLATLAHLTFVAHTTCAEHGTFAHLQSASGSRPAPGANEAVQAGESLTSDDHDHCLAGIARLGEAQVAAAAPSAVVGGEPAPAGPVLAVAPAPVRGALPAPIDILLLSPKMSPPL